MTARYHRGIATLTFLALAGCRDSAQRPPEPAETRAGTSVAGGAPDAFYLTELTFVSFRRVPRIVHLRLENRVARDQLQLAYRGWGTEGGVWTELVSVRDSLPVPRAAWRVVPAGPLRVRVDEGATLSTLRLDLPDGVLRIDSALEIAAWTSSTGQVESLAMGQVQDSAGTEPGLLVARQRARPASEPPLAAVAQSFLVTDTLGNGLLLMRDRLEPDAPATAWTWLEGLDSEWIDAAVLTLTTPAGSSGRWSLELPDAGIFAELQGAGGGVEQFPPEGPGFRLYRVEGALVMGAERRPVAGVVVEERGP